MVQRKESAVMASLSIIFLITYVVYVFMLHPWERISIYTKAGRVIVSVSDCDSELPIPDVKVYFYNSDGKLLKDEDTNVSGLASYESLPDCLYLKASYLGDRNARVCIGDGEIRTIKFCFDNPTIAPDIFYSTEYLGLVGAMSGEAISSKYYIPFTLAYPVENATARYPDYYLYSNILWSERMILGLTIDSNITNDVTLSFTMNSMKGNPTTVVRLGKNEIYRAFVAQGQTASIGIPKGLLNDSMEVSISCEFNSLYFWETHDCALSNITVKQSYYLPLKTTHEIGFDTSFLERNSATTHLEFTNELLSSTGLKAFINDYLIFESSDLTKINYEGYALTSDLNLTQSDNSLRFELQPGGNASLSDVKLWFRAENATSKSEELYFSVPLEILEAATGYNVMLYFNDVLVGGTLILTLGDASYEKEIMSAGWSVVKVDKEDVFQTNILGLSARNAKFEITDLRIGFN